MGNMTTTEQNRLLTAAYCQGLKKFRENYGVTERVTAEKFARERFMRDAAPKVTDSRFVSQGPDHAYFCLLVEHKKFNSYAEKKS